MTSLTSTAKPKLVFFGTGPVAAESLKLLSEWADIETVITKPRPPHHNGSVPVIELAKLLNLPLQTVSNKTALSSLIAASKYQSRLGVLIDFGIIVNQDVIDSFELGIINSHFSLLPQWRGADPITFAILSGQKNSGVSLMLLVEAMDEGPILAVGIQENVDTMTTPELTRQLILLSDGLLKVELPRYICNQSKGLQQSELHKKIPNYPAQPSYSRKLSKIDSVLDFSKPASQLEREIRGFLGWPGSRTAIIDIPVTITKTHISTPVSEEIPVNTFFVHSKNLCVQTGDGVLVVDELIPAGKKTMSGKAFLAGYGRALPRVN